MYVLDSWRTRFKHLPNIRAEGAVGAGYGRSLGAVAWSLARRAGLPFGAALFLPGYKPGAPEESDVHALPPVASVQRRDSHYRLGERRLAEEGRPCRAFFFAHSETPARWVSPRYFLNETHLV